MTNCLLCGNKVPRRFRKPLWRRWLSQPPLCGPCRRILGVRTPEPRGEHGGEPCADDHENRRSR